MGKKRSNSRSQGGGGKVRRGSSSNGVSSSTGHQSMLNVSGKQNTSGVYKRLVGSTKGKSIKKRVQLLEKNVMSDQEIKYSFGQTQTSSVITTNTPILTLLNGQARGDAVQQRIGDMCKALQITLTGKVETNGASCLMRVMIVADRDCQGAAIPLTGTNSLFGTATPEIYAMLNVNNANLKRYNIIHDEVFRIGTTMGDFERPISIKKKLNFKVNYKGGSTATIASIYSNSIYLIFNAEYTGANAILSYDFLYEYLDS